jgi:hypothetical protein
MTARVTAPTGRRVMVDGDQRLAVNATEASLLLGCSTDFFTAHVATELACVRRGRRRLFAVAELERWLADEAQRI